MFRWPWKNYLGRAAHITDEAILLFVDGELEPHEADSVRAHLESCWSCRARRHKMESAIAHFVEADKALMGDGPPKRWREFELRLDALIAQEQAAGRPVPRENVFRSPWRMALASIVLLAGVAAATFMIRNQDSPVPEARPGVSPRLVPPSGPPHEADAPKPTPQPAEIATRSAAEPPPAASTVLLKSIEIEYALHRVRACLGGEVQVFAGVAQLRVAGTAASRERKLELAAALGTVELPAWVRVEIEESGAKRSRSSAQSATPSAVLGAADGDRLEAGGLPVEHRLRAYLDQHPDIAVRLGPHVAVQEANFSSQAVAEANAATREAWALRRLVEQHGTKNLPEQARWLLEIMLREHIAQVQLHVGKANAMIAPVFVELHPEKPQASAIDRWQDLTLHLFATTERFERYVSILFAGDTSTHGGGEPSVRLDAMEQNATELLSTGAGIEQDAETAERRIAEVFSSARANAPDRSVRN